MLRHLACALAVALLLSALSLGTSGALAGPTGPVTNSGFEVRPAPESAGPVLADTPADRCYGIGHQVLYGSQSPLGQATGGHFGDPDPDAADPVGAITGVAADPGGTVDQQTGCFTNLDEGMDVAFLHPRKDAMRPVGWTVDIRNQAVAFGSDFDDDPDLEAKILADQSTSSHNLWQRFDSKHQAFTPNAEALEIDIEAGGISDDAYVRLKLEPTNASAYQDATYRDCWLTFGSTQLQNALASGEAGHLAADPTEATFEAREPSCEDLEDAWTASDATTQDKRAVLAQTRIAELSFWDWNKEVSEPTVVDDVRLPGASLVAEEIVAGNATLP